MMYNYTPMQGQNGYWQPDPTAMLRKTQKRMLKRQSIRAGLCVLLFLFLRFIASVFLQLTPLFSAYLQNDAAHGLIEIFYYLLCMFIPFAGAYLLMRNEDKATLTLFQKPVSKLSAVIAIPAGLMVCSVANFATNFLLSLLEDAGFTIDGGTYDTPTSGISLAYSLLSIGILPALVEEFALRGVVMQPLRRHGDRFAIVMSAFVFALMHGNLSQFTFAFPVGLALGYFVITTGSIWVGVAIHMLNNLYSVVLTYLLDVRPTAAESFYNIELSVSLVVGIACFVIFLKLCRRKRLQKTADMLKTGEKTAAYLLTVPMVIAVILLVIETIQLIEYQGS